MMINDISPAKKKFFFVCVCVCVCGERVSRAFYFDEIA